MPYKRDASTHYGKTIAEWVLVLKAKGDHITPNGLRGRIKRHPDWNPKDPWCDHRDGANRDIARLKELEKMAVSGLIRLSLEGTIPRAPLRCTPE